MRNTLPSLSAALLAASLCAAEASQPTAQTGRIKGFVLKDIDRELDLKRSPRAAGVTVRFQPLSGMVPARGPRTPRDYQDDMPAWPAGPWDSAAWRPPASPRSVAVRTAADGSFEFDTLPPGRGRVLIEDGSRDGERIVLFRDVEVQAGKTQEVWLIQRRLTATGRITRSGRPGAGLRVKILTHGSQSSANSGLTREDGTFAVPLMGDSESARVTIETVEGMTLGVRLDGVGREFRPLAIDLGSVIVSGTVTDKQTGAALPGVGVSISWLDRSSLDRDGRYQFGLDPRRRLIAVSDSDGRFQLDLDPGTYDVSTWRRGYHDIKTSLTVDHAGSPPLRLVLTPNSTISGRLTDASGQGVGGLSVVAQGAQSIGHGTTRADGSFLIDGLAAQPHTVTAFSDDGSFAAQSHVAADATDIALKLRPGGRVRLRVTGPGGAPLAGARAAVSKVDGERFAAWQGAMLTDAEGKVELSTPAGMVEVDVRNGAIDGQTMVAVAPGQSTDASLNLLMRIP
jgi:hypothetical protein